MVFSDLLELHSTQKRNKIKYTTLLGNEKLQNLYNNAPITCKANVSKRTATGHACICSGFWPVHVYISIRTWDGLGEEMRSVVNNQKKKRCQQPKLRAVYFMHKMLTSLTCVLLCIILQWFRCVYSRKGKSEGRQATVTHLKYGVIIIDSFGKL